MLKCKVCLFEERCGIRYGVFSCFGCMRFFERSATRDVQPCKYEGNCLIMWRIRDKCQSCHLKTCIKAGMSRDAPREGRVPIDTLRKQSTLGGLLNVSELKREKPKMHTTTKEMNVPKIEELKLPSNRKEVNVPNIEKPNIFPIRGKVHEPKLEETKIHATMKKANVPKNGKPEVPVTMTKVEVTFSKKPNTNAIVEKANEAKSENSKIHTAMKKVNDPKNEKPKISATMTKVPCSEKPNIHSDMKKLDEPKPEKPKIPVTTTKVNVPWTEKPDIQAAMKKLNESKCEEPKIHDTVKKMDVPKNGEPKISMTTTNVDVPCTERPDMYAAMKKLNEPKCEKPKILDTLRKMDVHKNGEPKISVKTTKVDVPCTEKPDIHAAMKKLNEPKCEKPKIHDTVKKINVPKNGEPMIPVTTTKVDVPCTEKPDMHGAMKKLNEPKCEKPKIHDTVRKMDVPKNGEPKIPVTTKKVDGPCLEKPKILTMEKVDEPKSKKSMIHDIMKKVNHPSLTNEKPNILATMERLNDHESKKPKIPTATTKINVNNVSNSEKVNLLDMEKVQAPKRTKAKVHTAMKMNVSHREKTQIPKTIEKENVPNNKKSKIPVLMQKENIPNPEKEKIIPGIKKMKDLESKEPLILDEKVHKNVPKLKKTKIASVQNTKADSQNKDLRAEQKDELKPTNSKKKDHGGTCNLAKEKIADPFVTVRTLTQPSSSQLNCPFNNNPLLIEKGIYCKKDLMERFGTSILEIIKTSERIRCFKTLSQRDQDTLLKAGIFEMLLVRKIYLFNTRDNFLFSDGPFAIRGDIKAGSEAEFMLNSIRDLTERMYNLPLSNHENWLFCAIALIAADHPGLRNTVKVLNAQKKLIGALKKSVSTNHSKNPTMFRDLMKIISDIRILNCHHSKKRMAYKIEHGKNKGKHATAIEIIEMITDTLQESIKNGITPKTSKTTEVLAIDYDLRI